MTRPRLTFLIALLLVAVAIGSASINAGSADTSATSAKIVFVNVEQGDAVVMRIGGKIIVSDTGEFRFDVLDDALRDGLKAKRIDVLVLGHAHDDHARNAAELLRKWEVRRVVMNQSLWWDGTDSNRAVKAAIRDEPNLERSFPDAGHQSDALLGPPPVEKYLLDAVVFEPSSLESSHTAEQVGDAVTKNRATRVVGACWFGGGFSGTDEEVRQRPPVDRHEVPALTDFALGREVLDGENREGRKLDVDRPRAHILYHRRLFGHYYATQRASGSSSLYFPEARYAAPRDSSPARKPIQVATCELLAGCRSPGPSASFGCAS